MRLLGWLAVAIIGMCLIAPAPSQGASWSSAVAGDFLDANNWSGGVPNGSGAVANIDTQPTATIETGGGPGVAAARLEAGEAEVLAGGGGGFTPLGLSDQGYYTTQSANDFFLNGTMTLGTLNYSNGHYRNLLGSGTLRFQSGGNATYQAVGTSLTLGVPVALASTTNFDVQSGYITVDGSVSGGGGVIKNGPGSLYFNGGTSYTGTTTINTGFLVTKTVPQGDIVLGDGVFYLDGGAGSTTHKLTLTESAAYVGVINSTLTLSGEIDGAGPLKLYGGGTLVLGETSMASYGGATVADGATINLSADERIPDASALDLGGYSGSATLYLNGHHETVGSLKGQGTVEVGIGDGLLTTGGDNTSTTYTGKFRGTGDVTKVGTGEWTLGADSLKELVGSISVEEGTLHLKGTKFETESPLNIGNAKTATLEITDGGNVETQGAELGVDGGTGTLTVQANSELKVHGPIEMGINSGYGILRADGVNAKVSADSISVGGSLLSYAGNGRIDITNGATVAVHDLLQVWDTGQVMMKEYNDGGRLIVTTGDPNSVPTRGGLYVGGGVGLGQMVIENGGSVYTSIARIDGDDGTYVEVRGHRVDESSGEPKDEVATLYIQQSLDSLVVGDTGSGRLGILDSGWVHYGDGVLGNAPHSYGGVLVTGEYTSVNGESRHGYFEGDYLTVGGAGRGELRIENGGYAYNLGVTIGSASTGVGAVTITSPGLSLNVFHTIMVGDAGNGKLQVFDGAAVTIANHPGSGLTIGNQLGSTGLVVVSGHNDDPLGFVPTKLDAGQNLTVGVQGTGVLMINDEAEVKSTSAIIGANSGADGKVYVSGGTWEITNQLLIGAGGHGLLKLDNNGLVTVQEAIIGPHGELGGNGGTLHATVINDGRVAPGNSPGILTIDGDFIQNSSGHLEVQVGGLTPGTFDQLFVTGKATLGGTLEMMFLNGYAPALGDHISFLNVSGLLSGDFNQIVFPNLAPGFLYETGYANGVYTLTALSDGQVVAVPEPAPLALAVIGALALCRIARRRKA